MRIPQITIALMAGTCCLALADTILLKSGEKLDGRVISEDGTSYLLEINITKSIKDERRIAKNLVREIITESADAKLFAKVTALVPTPDLLPAAAYTKRITLAKDFLRQFPKSKSAKQAQKILTQLETEHKAIAGGGIKLDGQLITPSDMEANAYEIHARVILHSVKQLSAAGKYREALVKWETLGKDYRNSSSFKNSLPLARKTLRSYQTQLQQLLNTLDARTKKREAALKSMNENDRTRTLAALAERQKKNAALNKKEKDELKLKWLTADPFSKEALEHNHRNTGTGLDQLSSIQPSTIREAGPAYRSAWSAIANGDLEAAGEQIQKLKSIRIPDRYITPMEKLLKDKQEARRTAAEQAKKEAAEKARAEKEAAEKATTEETKK